MSVLNSASVVRAADVELAANHGGSLLEEARHGAKGTFSLSDVPVS